MDDAPSVYHYFPLTLPALPTLALIVALEEGAEAVWFPIKPICEDGLGVDASAQQEKIKGNDEYAGRWRLIPFPTTKGLRPTLALEWESLGQWLLSIQAARIYNPEVRDFVGLFQRQAFNAIQGILVRREAAASQNAAHEALDEPGAGLGSGRALRLSNRPRGAEVALAQLRARLDHAENALAVVLSRAGLTSEPSLPSSPGALAAVTQDSGMATRAATCPHCGGALEIRVGSLDVVSAGE